MNKLLNNIKFDITHVFAVILFAFITVFYCFPILNGEKINQSDYKQFLGMSQEIIDYREKTGNEALWTNSMFGGMPAYQISVHYPNNILIHIDKFLQLYLPRPVGIMFLYFLGFYIFMLSLKIKPDISLLGALAFGLSSYLFIILEAGHNTKAHAIAYVAPCVASMVYCFNQQKTDRWYTLGGFFFAFLALGLHLRANHLQITYYLLFILFALWIYYLFSAFSKSRINRFIKSTLIFFVAGLMAISINLGNIWSTYEYSKYTIRGDSELIQDSGNMKSGLDKEYATAWSYGKIETFNLLFPNFVGGSSHAQLSEDSNLYQALRSNGVSAKNSRQFIQSAPTYFGPQSFTSGPVYMGAVIWLLFFISLFIVRKRIKWVFVSLVLFSFILAWGKYFPLVTNFLLDYFPLYNKFRTVSMILVIAEFAVPTLGILGLHFFINSNEDKVLKKRAVLFASGILLSISIFFLVFGNLLFDFKGMGDSQYPSWFLNALIEDRQHLFKMDIYRSLFFISVVSLLLFYMTHNNLEGKRGFIYVLGFIIIADMWFVNKRYLNADDFVDTTKVDQPFKPQFYDNTIKKDTSVYRVYNLNERIDAGARTSYFHHSIGGYHGAKLGKYQDVINQHISKGNFDVINMLNAKYIIFSDGQGNPIVQENTSALGNVWFIDSIHWVNSANEEIESLNFINPDNTVAINRKHESDINTSSLSSTGSINLNSYAPNKLVYNSSATSRAFAVFSEIFYPKGWEAYIDGEKVKHFSVNYILRGLVVPEGNHEIVFEFKPKSFFVSAKIAFFASFLLVIVGLMTFVGVFVSKK